MSDSLQTLGGLLEHLAIEEGEAASCEPRQNLHGESQPPGTTVLVGLARDSYFFPVLNLCPWRGPTQCGNY